jgi:PAS domain S-box-containing protein
METDRPPILAGELGPRAGVFEALDFAVLLSDENGRVVDCNGATERIFGWSCTELTGQRVGVLNAPQNAARLNAEIGLGLEREGFWRGQLSFQKKGGAQVVTDYSVRFIQFPNGKGRMQLHCHREVAAVGGDAWEQSGERLLLRALIDAVPDLIFCKDTQGRFLLRNSASERQMGVGGAKAIGLTVFELEETRRYADRYHEDDMEVIGQGRPVVNREEPYVAVDGSVGWYLTSKYPLRDESGEVIGLVGVSRDITAKRETESKLADERRLLRTLIDAIPDLIFFKDRAGRHLALNEAARRAFGVTDAEALGRTVRDWAVPEALVSAYEADDRQVVETARALLNREERCVDGRGEERRLMTSKYPLLDSEGNVYGLVGVSRDVTQLRESEREMESKRRQWMGHVERSPMAVVEWDGGLHVQLWSGQSGTLFGWESAEVVGRHFADLTLVHPEDMAEFARCMTGLVEGQSGQELETQVFEVRNRTKGGEVLHCVWQNTVMRDRDGRVESVLSLVRNVTERVRSEALLREHELLYYTLVEATGTGFVHLDEEGRVAEVNEEFMRMTGRRGFEDLLGMPLETWVAEADRDRVRQAYREGLKAGAIRNLEVDLVSPDGAVVPVELSAGVRETGKGKRLLAFCRDISARRQREAEQQDFDRQLQETQKLESLGILAGSIAHDFNNLLTGIIGNANLARCDAGENTELGVYLDQIEIAATRAADLCRQMLAYSGKGRFVVEELNLNSAVEETARLVQISMSKKVDLQYSLLPQVPQIRADATQVRQVLMNLLINAAEAIGDQRGTILVSTRVVNVARGKTLPGNLVGPLEPGRYVCLRVRDTGSGMSPETRKRIFEPFYTTKKTGRGLGLAAVLGIMRGHKGALSVESEPGKGTCFELHFPCIEKEGALAAAGGTGDAPWKGCGTVLVVDDEDTVRVTVSLMLQSLGFVVRHVSNGAEAVAAVAEREEDFALVLLDLTMPQLHGDESLRGMRRFQPGLKAIVMSGYDETEVVACFADQSMEAFLQKPFRLPQLRQKIQQLLDTSLRGLQPG